MIWLLVAAAVAIVLMVIPIEWLLALVGLVGGMFAGKERSQR